MIDLVSKGDALTLRAGTVDAGVDTSIKTAQTKVGAI